MQLTHEVIESRLASVFKELRENKNAVATKTLLKFQLPQNSLSKLCTEAGLLQLVTTIHTTKIYNYPDPESEEGKISISLMTTWLEENNLGRGGKVSKRKYVRKEMPAIAEVPPLLPTTTTERVIKLLTQALLEVGAPLGKSVPANFVREMAQKDVLIQELKAKVDELTEELKPFTKALERVAERRAQTQ